MELCLVLDFLELIQGGWPVCIPHELDIGPFCLQTALDGSVISSHHWILKAHNNSSSLDVHHLLKKEHVTSIALQAEVFGQIYMCFKFTTFKKKNAIDLYFWAIVKTCHKLITFPREINITFMSRRTSTYTKNSHSSWTLLMLSTAV